MVGPQLGPGGGVKGVHAAVPRAAVNHPVGYCRRRQHTKDMQENILHLWAFTCFWKRALLPAHAVRTSSSARGVANGSQGWLTVTGGRDEEIDDCSDRADFAEFLRRSPV